MIEERREHKTVSAFKRRHRRVSVSIDTNQLVWLDGQVDTRRFHSRSHAIEFAVRALRQQDDKTDRHT
jgi:Arc/MetJ-type ribon-helix-helix transcriptional regulator